MGKVSQNISNISVTPMVETKAEIIGSPIISTMRMVVRTAAPVFTRLLLRSTVARNRSGCWINRATLPAPALRVFTRWSKRALGRAMNAVSDAEKKAERIRNMASMPHLHESPASIF